MPQVTVTEARARVDRLLRYLERGETVVITRHGKKIAHLVPAADQERAERRAAIEEFKRLGSNRRKRRSLQNQLTIYSRTA